jgi:dipeptidyl aminopeptidase/acylaminoacyl peptidase
LIVRTLLALVASTVTVAAVGQPGEERPVATVADAITMSRIQFSTAIDGSVAAISPDGSKIAFVTWRGDLKKNTNVFSLMLVSLGPGHRLVQTLVQREFSGDPVDDRATAISSLSFFNDSSTLAWIGRTDSGSEQVFSIDIGSHKVRQWTHHPTAVRSYAFSASGRLKSFSAALYPRGNKTDQTLSRDGVFLWDKNVFPTQLSYNPAAPLLWRRSIGTRQYFTVNDDGTERLLYDSRSGASASEAAANPAAGAELSFEDDVVHRSGGISVDPSGRYMLLTPYRIAGYSLGPSKYRYYTGKSPIETRVAAETGLVDLQSSAITALAEAPSPIFARGFRAPLWAPDGKSVLIYCLGDDDPEADPAWREIDIQTRKVRLTGIPSGWAPLNWRGGDTLLLGRGSEFATITREKPGAWSGFRSIEGAGAFSTLLWRPAANGNIVIGTVQSPTRAPEIALYDSRSKQTSILTALNPQLEQINFGSVSEYKWKSTVQDDARGFLIKPVNYRPGERYPLVILLDDGFLGQNEQPYMIDAAGQTSGYAIQMLSARGIMVLYLREPRGLSSRSAAEGEWMRGHVESVVASLDATGLIDSRRVGIAGFSRAAYHVEYILMHSKFPFASASAIDGGSYEYTQKLRPFLDAELSKICTPLLVEAHGLNTVVSASALAQRLKAFGKPVEIIYFADASHNLVRPLYRLRSLETQIDWFLFWLAKHENPDPKKKLQYEHWRQMKRDWNKTSIVPTSSSDCKLD